MYERSYKKIAVIMSVVVTFFLVSYFAEEPELAMGDDVLVLGTNVYPPYIFINEENEFVGFDIDIATMIAEKMQRKLVVKHMGFDALIIALKQKKVDMIKTL